MEVLSLDEQTVLVSPPAEIDVTTAVAFADELATACREHPARVVVDFAGVVLQDSSAACVVLAAMAEVEDASCTVEVQNPSRLLRHVAQQLVTANRQGVTTGAGR